MIYLGTSPRNILLYTFSRNRNLKISLGQWLLMLFLSFRVAMWTPSGRRLYSESSRSTWLP